MFPMTCILKGCKQPRFSNGWCARHYKRWRITGHPLGTKRWIHAHERPIGSHKQDGKYMRVKTENGWQWEHRVLMEQRLGRKLGRNEVVHHVDGNGLNNVSDNLILMERNDHTRLHRPRRKSY